MRKTIICLFILSLLTEINAETNFGIRAGFNVSSFQKEYTQPVYGKEYGVFYDFRIIKCLYLSPELSYSTRGGNIRDKIVKSYGDNIYLTDIFVKISFIDLSLLLKCNINVQKELLIQPVIGISYSGYYKDLSQKDYKELIYIMRSGADTTVSYELYSLGETAPCNSGTAMKIGLSVYYKKIFIDIRYFRAFRDIGTAAMIEPIKYSLHSVSVTTGIVF